MALTAILAEESLMHGGFSMAVVTGSRCILEAGKAQLACAGFAGMAFIACSISMVSGQWELRLGVVETCQPVTAIVAAQAVLAGCLYVPGHKCRIVLCMTAQAELLVQCEGIIHIMAGAAFHW